MTTKKQIKFLKKQEKQIKEMFDETNSIILSQNYFSIMILLSSSIKHLEKGGE